MTAQLEIWSGGDEWEPWETGNPVSSKVERLYFNVLIHLKNIQITLEALWMNMKFSVIKYSLSGESNIFKCAIIFYFTNEETEI